MKKLLLSLVAVMAVFSLVFTACDQPTDYSVNAVSTLASPNVKITSVTGANIVTWDPVANATGYEVWRRDNRDGGIGNYVSLARPGSSGLDADDGIYVDGISDTNPLYEQVTYTYKVIAISSISSAPSRAAGDVTVQNSESEASVYIEAGKFPAKGTPLSDAAFGIAVTDVKVSVSANGTVTVTWVNPGHNPAVRYSFPVTNLNSVAWATYQTAATATAITTPGSYSVAVVPYLKDSGVYYPLPAPAYGNGIADIVYVQGLTAPTVNAVRATDDTEVVITITAATAGDDARVTGVIVEKAELPYGFAVNSNNALPAPYTWTALAGTPVKTGPGVYSIKDPAAAADKVLVYRAIWQTAEGQSASTVATALIAQTVTVATLSATSVTIVGDDSTIATVTNPSIYDTSTKGIQLALTASTPGATYTVYRQAVGLPNGTGTDVSGVWEAVKVDASNVESTAAAATALTFAGGADGANAYVAYTPTAKRQQYTYRVEGVKTGLNTAVSIASSAIGAHSPASTSIALAASGYTAISNASVGTPAETGYYRLDTTATINTLLSGEKIVVYGYVTTAPPTSAGSASSLPASEVVLADSATYYAAVTGTPAGALAFPTTVVTSLTTDGYYFAGPVNATVTRVVIE
jgi:hypothetical protein